MKNPFSKKAPSQQEAFLRTYLDRIAPGIVKFEVDHYIFGSTYRCVWALREYPASTEAQALLRELGEKSGVTLRIYCRQVSPGEEDRIIDNANKKNKLDGSDPNKLRQAVAAESNLRDVAELVHKMHREHEPLVHCAVYLEMTADCKERLRQLQTDVLTELVRCKLNVDKLLLRQKQGFCCVSPVGSNMLGREFERVLPAGSVANLYLFNYSGKTDPNGFYIGKDKYGSNIVVDFDRRDSDKTSANILILGNSGQGKSYLIKLLICNLLEAGKSAIALDAEHELEELCENLGGCFIDLMAGEKRINVLEVRSWNEDTDKTAPETFRKSTLLARHISFLKDFFRAYKDLTDPQLDTIEIMLSKLYARWGITSEILGLEDGIVLKSPDVITIVDARSWNNEQLYLNDYVFSVNGRVIASPCSQSGATFGYNTYLTQEGANTITITATDKDGYTATRSWTVYYEKGDVTVTVSVEATTVGLGYLIPPTQVTVPGGTDVMSIVLDLLEKNGYTHTGGSDYLASIAKPGINNGYHIDPELMDLIITDGMDAFGAGRDPKPGSMDSLGEFDYYRWSGWMFSYNGRYPGYSMSACKPQDGAVIRLRYTLALGKDIGGFSAALGSGYGQTSGNYYKEW